MLPTAEQEVAETQEIEIKEASGTTAAGFQVPVAFVKITAPLDPAFKVPTPVAEQLSFGAHETLVSTEVCELLKESPSEMEVAVARDAIVPEATSGTCPDVEE